MILPKAKVQKHPPRNSTELAGFQAFNTISFPYRVQTSPLPRNTQVLITTAFPCPTLKVLLDTTRHLGLFTQGLADLLGMELGRCLQAFSNAMSAAMTPNLFYEDTEG